MPKSGTILKVGAKKIREIEFDELFFYLLILQVIEKKAREIEE